MRVKNSSITKYGKNIFKMKQYYPGVINIKNKKEAKSFKEKIIVFNPVVFSHKINYHEEVVKVEKIYIFKNKRQQNRSKKKKNTLLFISCCVLSIVEIFQFHPLAFADEVTNGNYSIDIGNIDTNPQPTQKPIAIPTPTPYLQVLGTQTSTSEFTTGQNYTVTPSSDSFSVSFPQSIIDFGILSSTNPVIRTSTISFSSPEVGAEIVAYENQPLQSVTKDIIQNTSCDNGACTPDIAAAWDNTLTYGFGYRCDSSQTNICDPQFSSTDYFKQYPSDTLGQPPTHLMTTYTNSAHNSAIVTYKVNISGTQKSEGYYNSITYLAVPNF